MASQMAWMFSTGLHDRAVWSDEGGVGAAAAQPAVEFAAGGGGHDGGSAVAELVSLRIAERRRADQREAVPDDLIETQAVAQNWVGAQCSGQLPGGAGFDHECRPAQPGGHAVGGTGARAR